MKMVRAVVRPENAEDVVNALAEGGFVALTKLDVVGRGEQKGIHIGNISYEELSKVMLMIVTSDENAEKVAEIICRAAYTGNYGDGKIFISPVEKAYTIRTRHEGI